jgi:hypothetical protein
LSSRRSRSGTSSRPTIAEAKTGSVGDRIAPSSKAVGQSSPAKKCAGTAMPIMVSGIARPKARPDSRQPSFSAGRLARRPSVNKTVNRAMSASPVTNEPLDGMSTRPNPPCPISAPATRNISAVDNTVRAATPDSDTLISSTTPKARTSATRNSRRRTTLPTGAKCRPDFPARRA